YYGSDWLWRLRGAMDRLAGGPGLRRGRRSARELRLGHARHFWRVTGIGPPRRLELRAEMRLPGAAILTLEVEPAASGRPGSAPQSVIIMTARFRPRGLAGIGYWYSVKPLHGIVFRGMLTGLVRQAERSGVTPATPVDGGGRPRDTIGHADAGATAGPDVDRTL